MKVWLSRALRPTEIAPLVIFRVAFGVLAAWEMAYLLWTGWVDRHVISPPFHFTYQFFDWVEPWPGQGPLWHVATLSFLGLLIAVGLFFRAAVTAFLVGFAWLFLIDKTYYLNHFYLIGLLAFLLALSPAHREFSLDVFWRRVPSVRTMPVCWLWVFRFQFAVVYFFGGVSKLNGDWLRGEPVRQWLAERAGESVPAALASETWFILLFAWAGLLIDLLAVPLLLWKRTRPAAFVVTLLFHAMNSQLWTIGVFPWLMIAGTALFFPPERFRAVLNRWKPSKKEPAPQGIPEDSLPRRGRLLVLVLFVFVAVQCVLPCRRFLYPGSFLWTGEGTRFGWNMLHRRTTGAVLFVVRDPKTGREWIIHPREYLTPRQAEQLAARPDMLLQFAHALAEEAALKTGNRPEVRARGLVSLNGRAPQPLADPTVDLAAQPRGFRPKTWIMPLDSPRPK